MILQNAAKCSQSLFCKHALCACVTTTVFLALWWWWTWHTRGKKTGKANSFSGSEKGVSLPRLPVLKKTAYTSYFWCKRGTKKEIYNPNPDLSFNTKHIFTRISEDDRVKHSVSVFMLFSAFRSCQKGFSLILFCFYVLHNIPAVFELRELITLPCSAAVCWARRIPHQILSLFWTSCLECKEEFPSWCIFVYFLFQSFSEMFVKFLEIESTPSLPAPRLPVHDIKPLGAPPSRRTSGAASSTFAGKWPPLGTTAARMFVSLVC